MRQSAVRPRPSTRASGFLRAARRQHNQTYTSKSGWLYIALSLCTLSYLFGSVALFSTGMQHGVKSHRMPDTICARALLDERAAQCLSLLLRGLEVVVTYLAQLLDR